MTISSLLQGLFCKSVYSFLILTDCQTIFEFCKNSELYKKVKDPNLVASLSGHTDGSRAFARYREIDNDMKRELVALID